MFLVVFGICVVECMECDFCGDLVYWFWWDVVWVLVCDVEFVFWVVVVEQDVQFYECVELVCCDVEVCIVGDEYGFVVEIVFCEY